MHMDDTWRSERCMDIAGVRSKKQMCGLADR